MVATNIFDQIEILSKPWVCKEINDPSASFPHSINLVFKASWFDKGYVERITFVQVFEDGKDNFVLAISQTADANWCKENFDLMYPMKDVKHTHKMFLRVLKYLNNIT
jgi:hypothetical protein